MPSNKPTVMQQLGILRDLFERFGALHEVHIQNLRAWPWYIDSRLDPKEDKIEAEVDTEHSQITYTFKTNKVLKRDKDYNNRILAVWEWVKALLGNSWKIQLLYNSEAIFSFEDCYVRTTKRSSKKRTKSRKRRRG